MTIALQVIPDRFASLAQGLNNQENVVSSQSFNPGGVPFIRRPTRGIVLKEDTFATIRVAVASSGQSKKLVDAGSRRQDGKGLLEINGKRATDIYSNFLLQQVQEDRMEKQQILETFGEPYIFLFGERARTMNFAGILANTFDFNWEAEWWHNYENYLRGTRCVENDARVYITFDNTIVGGYIISSNASKNASDRNFVNFQFQLFVTSYSNFSAIGDPTAFPGFPMSGLTDGVVDNETASVFRPALLTGGTPVTQDGTDILSQVDSLIDAVSSKIQLVEDTWNTANRIINTALTSLAGLAPGSDSVRVPYGFAGTMAFDDDADANLYTVQYGESIKYSVFSDNSDEYVGVGDQYGSSDVGLLGFIPGLGFDNTNDEMMYNQQLVEKAAQEWEAQGYPIPLLQLGGVSKFIVGHSVGLLAVGASSSWSSFSHTAVPGSAGGSFGAGLGKAVGLPG